MKQPKKILEYERYATRTGPEYVDRTKMKRLVEMYFESNIPGQTSEYSKQDCRKLLLEIIRDARKKILNQK